MPHTLKFRGDKITDVFLKCTHIILVITINVSAYKPTIYCHISIQKCGVCLHARHTERCVCVVRTFNYRVTALQTP